MDKKTEALKLALEALEWAEFLVESDERSCQEAKHSVDKAITAIREALAEQCVCGEPDTLGTHRTDGPCLAEQPAQQDIPKIGCVNHDCDKCKAQQQEPYAWMAIGGTIWRHKTTQDDVPLYTTLPHKPWVVLTKEEILEINDTVREQQGWLAFVRAIEAKLKEKNGQI